MFNYENAICWLALETFSIVSRFCQMVESLYASNINFGASMKEISIFSHSEGPKCCEALLLNIIVRSRSLLFEGLKAVTPDNPRSTRYMVIHYSDVMMGAMASQITSLTIVYSTVYSGADQRKHQSSASLAFVRGIHWSPVNSPHKWAVTRKMFPFDDVLMYISIGRNKDSSLVQ